MSSLAVFPPGQSRATHFCVINPDEVIVVTAVFSGNVHYAVTRKLADLPGGCFLVNTQNAHQPIVTNN